MENLISFNHVLVLNSKITEMKNPFKEEIAEINFRFVNHKLNNRVYINQHLKNKL